MEKIEECAAIGSTRFLYIPGLLSFREAPILLKTFKKLKDSPDIILFDGHGIAIPPFWSVAAHGVDS